MKIVGLMAKRRMPMNLQKKKVYETVYHFLLKKNREVLVQKHVAEILGLKKYREFLPERDSADVIIVMGGDGTILSIVQRLKDFSTKIFGINLGTLGFMSEIPPVNITSALNRIFSGEYTIDERALLEVEVKRGGAVIEKFRALNEAVIAQGALARMIRLSAKVDGRKLTTYHADGLIVSTPTGSTAYSLSAGGPIVYPGVKALIITPICPHSFTQKPIVIPDSKRVEIAIRENEYPTNLSIDGQTSFVLEKGDIVRIFKGEKIHFLRLPTESYFETLRRKLNWGERG